MLTHAELFPGNQCFWYWCKRLTTSTVQEIERIVSRSFLLSFHCWSGTEYFRTIWSTSGCFLERPLMPQAGPDQDRLTRCGTVRLQGSKIWNYFSTTCVKHDRIVLFVQSITDLIEHNESISIWANPQKRKRRRRRTFRKPNWRSARQSLKPVIPLIQASKHDVRSIALEFLQHISANTILQPSRFSNNP